MTKTTMTYAIPPEPDGPVWDKDGEMWERDTYLGAWDLVAGYLSRTWPMLLSDYGPVTSTPPWKPEVGGIVETREQYEAMPAGSIVESSSGHLYRRTHAGAWLVTGSSITQMCAELAGTPRTILRVGWSL